MTKPWRCERDMSSPSRLEPPWSLQPDYAYFCLVMMNHTCLLRLLQHLFYVFIPSLRTFILWSTFVFACLLSVGFAVCCHAAMKMRLKVVCSADSFFLQHIRRPSWMSAHVHTRRCTCQESASDP